MEIRLANAFEAHRCDESRGNRLSVRVIDLFGPNRFHPGNVSPTWGAMGTRRELSLRRSPPRREWRDGGTVVSGSRVAMSRASNEALGEVAFSCGATLDLATDSHRRASDQAGGRGSFMHLRPARPGRAERVAQLANRRNAAGG
jgi:hypothetical protein